jgi:hypothetical protein
LLKRAPVLPVDEATSALDTENEDGTVGELPTAGGRFDEFWRQQRDAAEWRIHVG